MKDDCAFPTPQEIAFEKKKCALAAEGFLVPLMSFRDLLLSCEERDATMPPMAVGSVLEVLIERLERDIGKALFLAAQK